MHTTLAFHRIFLENPMMLYILLLFFLWICNIFCIMISEIWQTCILHLQSITSWLWSYGNYLCNQCISPLTLCVRIPLGLGLLDITLCDKVCQWLAAGRWFSQGTMVSSTNKANRHDISEILLKVALNIITLTINHIIYIYRKCWHSDLDFWFDFLCFNATFSNFSAISWRPVLVMKEAGVPVENHRPWGSNW